MIDPLHNKREDNVPKAEPCSLLCSNNDVIHGSAFGFGNQEPPIEILLEQLAELIVQVYLYDKDNPEKDK